jgi:hypothetical protein
MLRCSTTSARSPSICTSNWPTAVWHPWHGPLHQPYRFRYRDDREYRLHSAATGLLYRQLLDRHVLDWLSDYPTSGHRCSTCWPASTSTPAYWANWSCSRPGFGGPGAGRRSARAMAAPKHALQRKLLDGLRYLLKEQLKLNQPEASDGWLTEDALWLVSKTVSDKLRAHLLSQGIDGIPANNTAVFNVLQDHGMLQPTPDGKAVWRATVTSTTGWSHSFTLLRLAPALIWESGERPALRGPVEIDATPAEKRRQHVGSRACRLGEPAQGGQEPIWEGDSTTTSPPPQPSPCPTSWRICWRW